MPNNITSNYAITLGIYLLLFAAVFVKAHASNIQPKLEESGLVDTAKYIDAIHYDIRYAGHNNFVGQPVDGYLAAKCLLHIDLMTPLKQLSKRLSQQNYRLRIYDCYRPEKAVAHFMRWVRNLNDTKTKATFYPNLAKSQLVGDYIAEKSGHSTGFTVDLTLEIEIEGRWQPIDMGSNYDVFDPISHSNSPLISEVQQDNRNLLKNVMSSAGFSHYKYEWWHYTYTKTPKSMRSQSFNFDIE